MKNIKSGKSIGVWTVTMVWIWDILTVQSPGALMQLAHQLAQREGALVAAAGARH